MVSPKKRILIAEDDQALSKVLQIKFKQVGYEPLQALNGEETLEVLKKEKPDLLLLDIMMPIKSGFEVLEEMKNDPELKKIPVIIISNLGQEEDIKRAEEYGVKDYIVKAQVSIIDVIEKVNNFFKSKK